MLPRDLLFGSLETLLSPPPPGHTLRQRVGTETLLLPLSRSIPLSSYPVKRTTLGRMEIAANIHVYQETADN